MNGTLKSALAWGVAITALAWARAGVAQTAPSQSSDNQRTLQQVVVTGSLIPQPNLTATSPISSVSTEDINLQDSTNIEDVLDQSPQVYGSSLNDRSGFATGASTLNLRNLGDERTLVLIDGERLAPDGATGSDAGDINMVPQDLIKRVDIVTGGASAAYGSDAVAGVVNFILDDHFEGVRLDLTAGGDEHSNSNAFLNNIETAAGGPAPSGTWWGGYHGAMTLIAGAGTPDDKGHGVFYLGYKDETPIYGKDLQYGACGLAEVGNTFACQGIGIPASSYFELINGTPTSLYLNPKTNGLGPFANADLYNLDQYNNLQGEDHQYTAGFIGDYQIAPQVDVYSKLMYMYNYSHEQVFPSELANYFTFQCSNPMLTSQELTAFCGSSTAGTFSTVLTRVNAEGEDRQYINDNKAYRVVLGARGDVVPDIDYDVRVQSSASDLASQLVGDLSSSRFTAAVNDCPAGSPAGCVPYDIFSAGAVTQAAEKYVTAYASTGTYYRQNMATATIDGNLLRYGLHSPWSDQGIGFAVGTDYRSDTLDDQCDKEYASGDLETFGTCTPLGGKVNVYEVFSEVRIPIIDNKPFIHDLSLDSGYRYSDYNTSGGSSTFSIEGNYSPVQDFRVRGSFNRAERSPNVYELYEQQGESFGVVDFDGCAGTTPAYTPAQCERSGVTPAEYGHIAPSPGGAYEGLFGGNPHLNPEVASTYSWGFVLTPRLLPGFTMSADYFNIHIANVVSMPSAQSSLDECGLTGLSFDCALVHRDPSTGSLFLGSGYVIDTYVNAGSLATSGVDVDTHYHFRLPKNWGALNLSLTGTFLSHYTSETVPNSGVEWDCAGYYGPTCGQPMPHWRHIFTAEWVMPWNVDLAARWRYVGSVRNDGYIAATGDMVYAPDAKIPSFSYLDLIGSYHLSERYTFRLGVNNILDKDPPLIGANAGGFQYVNNNTFPSTYDPFGRTFFVKVQADF
jgi:outer membrane receptor protein involved in Fe transport